MAIFVFISSSSKIVFEKKKVMLKIDSAASGGGQVHSCHFFDIDATHNHLFTLHDF